MGKSILEINYTKTRGNRENRKNKKKKKKNKFTCFTCFNGLVKKYLMKNKSKEIVYVTDYIYPLIRRTKNIYKIKDHVNLSGSNPLKGPSFISLKDIYDSNDLKSGIVVAGLKEGVHPNSHEIKVLLKSNIKAYCYNLVSTVILAASHGLKVKAIGIVVKQW